MEEEHQPSKYFIDMWQQHHAGMLLPLNHDLSGRFDVQLRGHFVIEYLPHRFAMHVRSGKLRVLLERGALVEADDGVKKESDTMSIMFKYTAPVTESELERIVSSKERAMDADPCNAGRDLISIVMSLRVFYVKDYTQEVELSRASRLGSEGPETLNDTSRGLDFRRGDDNLL